MTKYELILLFVATLKLVHCSPTRSGSIPTFNNSSNNSRTDSSSNNNDNNDDVNTIAPMVLDNVESTNHHVESTTIDVTGLSTFSSVSFATYVTEVDGNITIYSGTQIDYPATNVTVHQYKRRPRDVHKLPDLYYVTPRVNRTGRKFPEYTENNVTYKHVDITDDIITWGLNQNIHLTDYLENVPGAHLTINIKDRMDVLPFKYYLSPNRAVFFYVDNNRLRRHFRKERNSLLNLALSLDPDDHATLQQLYYRIGSVLDSDQRLRRSFMTKIIRNLLRNRVSPIDLTLEKLERELSDAQVNEFALRQLRVDDINTLPIAELYRRDASSTTESSIESLVDERVEVIE